MLGPALPALLCQKVGDVTAASAWMVVDCGPWELAAAYRVWYYAGGQGWRTWPSIGPGRQHGVRNLSLQQAREPFQPPRMASRDCTACSYAIVF